MEIRRRLQPAAAREGGILDGVAITYGDTALVDGVEETFDAGAFGESIRADILCLADHDPSKLLGRTASGSLRLQDGPRQLDYALSVPNTTLGRDTLEMASRRDLGGVSVGFFISRKSERGRKRTIHQAQLVEISIVSAFPAYAQTSVNQRSGYISQRQHRELLNYIAIVANAKRHRRQ